MYGAPNRPTKDRNFLFLSPDKLIYTYKVNVRSLIPLIVLNGFFMFWNVLKNRASMGKVNLIRVHSWVNLLS